MAKGINIGVASDTREFDSGIRKGVIEPLEDAQKALQKLDKAGDLSKTERGMEDAQDATQKLERKLDDVTDKIRSTGRAGKDIGDGVKDGTRKAGEATEEFASEAKQNIGETFSSFRGDVSDFGQIAQDTLGGLASSMGGLPAIALTAAGAAGIGLILGALEKSAESAEDFKAKVSELAAELVEAGKTGAPSIEFINDKLKELAATTEDGKVNLSKLSEVANKAKSPFEDLAQAYAGNGDGLDDLISKTEEYYDALDEEQRSLDLSTEAGNRRNGEIAKELDGKEQYLSYLYSSKDALDQATVASDAYARSGGPEMETKRALIESVNDAYDGAADSVEDFIDKESGAFDVQAYIDKMAGVANALRQYQENLASSDLSAEARNYLSSLGAETAALTLQGYKDATPAQRAELARIWTEAGRSDSADYSRNFSAGVPAQIASTSVGVRADTNEYDRVIRDRVNQQLVQTILVREQRETSPGRMGVP